MKEDHLESACLDWLRELGWACVHGDDVSPGGAQCARARYSDVVLVPRLREAVQRLNCGLTPAEIDEAVDKLAAYGAQSRKHGAERTADPAFVTWTWTAPSWRTLGWPAAAGT